MVLWGITYIHPNKNLKNPLEGFMLWVPRMDFSVEPKILKEKCLAWYTLGHINPTCPGSCKG